MNKYPGVKKTTIPDQPCIECGATPAPFTCGICGKSLCLTHHSMVFIPQLKTSYESHIHDGKFAHPEWRPGQ